MADEKYFECGVCGALINKETGETYFKKGSNAESMESLKDENSKLKADLSRVTEAHNKLIGIKPEGSNGGDGTEKGESDNPGKQKSGDSDEEFWGDDEVDPASD